MLRPAACETPPLVPWLADTPSSFPEPRGGAWKSPESSARCRSSIGSLAPDFFSRYPAHAPHRAPGWAASGNGSPGRAHSRRPDARSLCARTPDCVSWSAWKRRPEFSRGRISSDPRRRSRGWGCRRCWRGLAGWVSARSRYVSRLPSLSTSVPSRISRRRWRPLSSFRNVTLFLCLFQIWPIVLITNRKQSRVSTHIQTRRASRVTNCL